MSDETDTMSEPYTPDTVMVRLAYLVATKDVDPGWTRKRARAEFDRWLSSEKAKAVDEAQAQRAQIATQEAAGEPGIDSAGRGASGGLGERLRALRRRFIGNAGEDDPNNDQDLTITGYTFWAVVQGLEAMANEVDVLEGKHARQAQTIGELQDVRERLGMVRELAGAIRETSHCSHLATDIETLLDTPLSELRALRDTP